jgi:hypothetical protein
LPKSRNSQHTTRKSALYGQRSLIRQSVIANSSKRNAPKSRTDSTDTCYVCVGIINVYTHVRM